MAKKSARGTDRYIYVRFNKRYNRRPRGAKRKFSGWCIYRGRTLLWSEHFYKYEAFRHAQLIARRERTELVVMDRHGRFHERRSYGNDPKRRPG